MDDSQRIKKLLKIPIFTPLNLIGNAHLGYNCYGDQASHEVVGCDNFILPGQIKNKFVRSLIDTTKEIQLHIFSLNQTESVFCLIYLKGRDEEFELSFWRKRGLEYLPSPEHVDLFIQYLKSEN
jgi:hypothetical protein